MDEIENTATKAGGPGVILAAAEAGRDDPSIRSSKPGGLMGHAWRLAKQPVWVRDLVANLESTIRQAGERIENLQEALRVANGDQAGGRVKAELASGQQICLGDGAVVDFELEDGRFTVTPENDHLMIDGPIGLAIEPIARNSFRVVIR